MATYTTNKKLCKIFDLRNLRRFRERSRKYWKFDPAYKYTTFGLTYEITQSKRLRISFSLGEKRFMELRLASGKKYLYENPVLCEIELLAELKKEKVWSIRHDCRF